MNKVQEVRSRVAVKVRIVCKKDLALFPYSFHVSESVFEK